MKKMKLGLSLAIVLGLLGIVPVFSQQPTPAMKSGGTAQTDGEAKTVAMSGEQICPQQPILQVVEPSSGQLLTLYDAYYFETCDDDPQADYLIGDYPSWPELCDGACEFSFVCSVGDCTFNGLAEGISLDHEMIVTDPVDRYGTERLTNRIPAGRARASSRKAPVPGHTREVLLKYTPSRQNPTYYKVFGIDPARTSPCDHDHFFVALELAEEPSKMEQAAFDVVSFSESEVTRLKGAHAFRVNLGEGFSVLLLMKEK
ncbi:hypothetical protein M4951_16440 [Blastopirellula sp. J2-11]|uniref:hypothetical protein n=1 Tax=Blastopirellula sp. J2-11 TaxID=2943192 RepID=UPI0021C8949D|nr:hypothetical protein [Blastopirellula sp. J2-11]UUO04969.1 hypothetical protein M4951_16440 [Blastopirellula sp. J2-11]